MLTFLKPSVLYYALLNLAIVAAVGGAVILIANHLDQIPALLFIGGFAGVALLLMMGLWFSQRTGADEAVGIWSFWAGIAYGLALFAGAHWFDLSTFIPDLLLFWIVGLALLGYWIAGVGQMALVALLTGVWFGLVFLYGYSYLPGVVLLLALYGFVARRRYAAVLFLLTVLLTLLVVNLYFYDLLHPAHFPLTLSITQGLVTLALLGGLHGVVALLAARDGEGSPWPAYGDALHNLLQGIGVALLVPLIFGASWATLRAAFDGSLLGLVLGFGLFLITAIVVFGRQTTLALRATFGGWALGYLLLTIGIDDHMLDMMHFTHQAYLPLIGVGMALLAAGGYLVAGIQQRCLVRLATGLALLLTAAVALTTEWLVDYPAQAMIWFGVALLILIVAQNLRRQMTPIDAPLADPQVIRQAAQLAKEVAL
ncbi:MAG: hypothetical protein R3E79_25720 [Caldilineaceae bacterium]